MNDLQIFTDRISRFARVRRLLRDTTLTFRLAFLALLAGTAGLLLLSGWLPNAWLNLALFAILALFWLSLLITACVRWTRRRPPLDEAFRMEELAGGLNSRLVSAWDFLTRGLQTPLTMAVIGQAREDLHFPFEARLDRGERNRRLQRFCVILAFFVGLGLTPWFGFAAVLANLSKSWFVVRETLFPIQYHMEPGPGIHVVRLGQDVPLSIHFPGRDYSAVQLIHQADKDPETIDLAVDETGRAAHIFKSDVEADYAVRFAFGKRQSEEMTLIFTTPPILVNMQTELVFPAYTRLLPRSLEGIQERLVGLPGTRMVLGFTFSKELDEASLVWDDGSPELRLETTGRFATVELLHQRERTARLKARSKVGNTPGFEMEFPVEIKFVVQEDEKPQVLLPRHLKDDMPYLEEPAKLFGFGVQATDDFGVSRVVLKWQKSTVDNSTLVQEKGEVERIISPVQPKVLVNFEKVFAAMALKPGDKITFWVEAHDNMTPKAQMTASRRCSLFIFQDALGGLSIKELGFGSDTEMARGRIPKATKATAVKAPEGLLTKEGVRNEFEAQITTGTQAPTVRGEHGQATRDYFRLFSTVRYPDETPPTQPRKDDRPPEPMRKDEKPPN